MGEIVHLLFYYDCFGIKYPTKVDMPLNKKTKANVYHQPTHPSFVEFVFLFISELGEYTHPCEDDIVCKNITEKIPYFNAPVYLENKQQIGKIDEIFGSIKDSISFIAYLSNGSLFNW